MKTKNFSIFAWICGKTQKNENVPVKSVSLSTEEKNKIIHKIIKDPYETADFEEFSSYCIITVDSKKKCLFDHFSQNYTWFYGEYKQIEDCFIIIMLTYGIGYGKKGILFSPKYNKELSFDYSYDYFGDGIFMVRDCCQHTFDSYFFDSKSGLVENYKIESHNEKYILLENTSFLPIVYFRLFNKESRKLSPVYEGDFQTSVSIRNLEEMRVLKPGKYAMIKDPDNFSLEKWKDIQEYP